MTEYVIPNPPKSVFEYQTNEESVLRENLTTYIIKEIKYDQGIQVYYENIPYPRKGFPFTEAVCAINVVKKLFVETIKLLSPIELLIRLISLEKTLGAFNSIGFKILAPYIVKPELMTDVSAELQGTIYVFLTQLGIDRDVSSKFGRLFGTLIEYDNAYRYRLEDIMTETTPEKLISHPYKEINRLIKLFILREKCDYISNYLRKLKYILPLLLIPKIKKSFIIAIERTDFKRLQLDEIDRYWCKMRPDYNFFGQEREERVRGFNIPQGVAISV